jgi:hypothetical protein
VNEKAFLVDIVRSGYGLADDWSTTDKKCVIPLHPERKPTYPGFSLRRGAAGRTTLRAAS